MACCCVAEIVETNRPRPSVLKRYTDVSANNSKTLPRSGTANHNTTIARTRHTSIMPTSAYGSSLPTMSSQRRSGVTLSCSSVPSSFSRTIPIDDKFVVMTSNSIARMPGSMKSRLSSRGLNQTRTRGSSPPGVGEPSPARLAAASRRAAISSPYAAMRFVA